MMKPKLSLKLLVVLAFLSLGILLVLGYSLLSAQFFLRGMDSLLTGNMEQAARSYLESVPAARRELPSQFSGYHVARRWEQVPRAIRQAFGQPPTLANVLQKKEDTRWLRPPERIYFLLRYQYRNETLFISHQASPDTVSVLAGRSAAQSRHTLLLISLLTALVLAVLIWLLVRHISRPVAELGHWARALTPEKLAAPTPDFAYPELNALAELIRTSLSSVQQSLEREHRFLRHTSHELRTPISVIRNNIELSRKLQQQDSQQTDPRQCQVIDRIDRASLTMKHLTETLLWLSRDDTDTLPHTPLRLDHLLQQLVEELRYLLKDKAVAVSLKTTPCELTLPEVAARIVLGNLVRNAFQHTWEGEITIHQQDNSIEIINQQQREADAGQEQGFGLGLQLTAQLTERLGWAYHNEAGARGHRVWVTLASSKGADNQRI